MSRFLSPPSLCDIVRQEQLRLTRVFWYVATLIILTAAMLCTAAWIVEPGTWWQLILIAASGNLIGNVIREIVLLIAGLQTEVAIPPAVQQCLAQKSFSKRS